MRLASLKRLVQLSLKRDPRGAAASLFGVVVGVGALVFFVALGLGVSDVVRQKVFPVDASLVEVVPAALDLGLLGGGRLDEAAVARLAALPGVVARHRKMNVRVPAVSIYEGDFFGRALRMGLEVLVVGADKALVASDVALGDFTDQPQGPVPAIASSRLVEIYNKSFAPARGLPQLGPAMLVGFRFPVDFNRSFVTASPSGPVTSTQAQVVGISDRGLLAGIMVPLETAVRLNRASNADASTYTGVVLQVSDPAQVSAVVAAVKDMGFRIDDQDRRMAENAGAAVAITTSALALLSMLICVLAAFNISHALSAAVRSRERELGLFRAVGATRADVRWVVLGEALVLGLAGGVVGTTIARLTAVALDLAASRWLPPFPFQPESFFRWPLWLAGAGVVIGVVAAVGGALRPAARAAKVDPARVLAGG
jgi:putative ABC transport system permease protein